MKEFFLALDLQDDPQLIAAYKKHHQAVWPEVIAGLRKVGVLDMKIYSFANRLVMQMTTRDDYDREQALAYQRSVNRVIEWEQLMENYQQRIPGTPDGQKWMIMACCFDLQDYPESAPEPAAEA